MECAIEFAPNHISAYALTIEPRTVFGKWAVCLENKKVLKGGYFKIELKKKKKIIIIVVNSLRTQACVEFGMALKSWE